MFNRLILYCLLFVLIAFRGNAADVIIKSTTNRNDIHVGDYWIAQDLAAGFEKNGVTTDIDYRGEYHRIHSSVPQVNVYMRGYTKYTPPFDAEINVLYSYYPMAYTSQSKNKPNKQVINHRSTMPLNASLDDDWQNYDVIAVASSSYAEQLNKAGIKAFYIPQFTNPEKFYPDVDDTLKQDILFVGSNWHDRTSLRYAIESGFYVAVYGYNWDGIVPKEMYKGNYIDNQDLRRHYSSAKIVLNDHRPDMKEFGFINNRIYDATASGAMVISDYMPEIEQIYGDSVPMYRNKEELAQLLNYYLSHEDERVKKAAQARDITLKNFTYQIAAQKIMEAAIDWKNSQNN